MHALVYIFRTENREELEFNEEIFNEDNCYINKENCEFPLFDWFQLGGRFRGTIPLKQEYLDKQEENLGKPGVFENEPMLPNGVDYAKYEWIDLDNWKQLPFAIIIDNKVVIHPFADEHEGKNYEMITNEETSIILELKQKGFYDVLALDIHF